MTFARSMLALAWGAALAASASAARAEDAPPPPRYPPSSVRIPLIAGGLGLAGAAYAAGFAASEQWPEAPGTKWFRVPVAGPWIALGKMGCSPPDPSIPVPKGPDGKPLPQQPVDCTPQLVFQGILTVLNGLAQVGGLAIAGEGIFMKTERSSKEAGVIRLGSNGLTIKPSPVVSAQMTGLGISGTF